MISRTKSGSNWSSEGGTDPNLFRKLLSKLSYKVRCEQYKFFINTYKPTDRNNVLDVGVSPDLTLSDTDFFEQVYPFKKRLSIASIEDCKNIVLKYKLKGYVRINPNSKMPVRDKEYDYVVSWATLEHVGSRKNQEKFIKELYRIGKKVFITTPDKKSIYEPHTVTFFLHWLPAVIFRKIIFLLGKEFWSKESNLNILSENDAKTLTKNTSLKVKEFKILGFLPSHLLIISNTSLK